MILGREGANPKISGCFYLAVVQEILIFGLEMWMVTPKMGRILGVFHHSLSRRLLVCNCGYGCIGDGDTPLCNVP